MCKPWAWTLSIKVWTHKKCTLHGAVNIYRTSPSAEEERVYTVTHLVCLFVTPWTVAHQAPLSMGLSRQEYWSGVVVSYSRGSSQLRDWTHVSGVSCIGRRIPSPLSHRGSPPAEDQVINIIVTPQMGTWEIFVHSLHLVSILSLQIGREWD